MTPAAATARSARNKGENREKNAGRTCPAFSFGGQIPEADLGDNVVVNHILTSDLPRAFDKD